MREHSERTQHVSRTFSLVERFFFGKSSSIGMGDIESHLSSFLGLRMSEFHPCWEGDSEGERRIFNSWNSSISCPFNYKRIFGHFLSFFLSSLFAYISFFVLYPTQALSSCVCMNIMPPTLSSTGPYKSDHIRVLLTFCVRFLYHCKCPEQRRMANSKRWAKIGGRGSFSLCFFVKNPQTEWTEWGREKKRAIKIFPTFIAVVLTCCVEPENRGGKLSSRLEFSIFLLHAIEFPSPLVA